MNDKHSVVTKIFHNREELEAASNRVAQEISEDYKDRIPVFVVVLKGASIWAMDVFKKITINAQIEFVTISSYNGGLESTNEVKLLAEIPGDLTGRDIIIFEDIVDSGLSISFLHKYLNKEKNVKSIKVASMLNKDVGIRKYDEHKVDYYGFNIEDEFVVGYGLDYKELYRNLPYIGIFNEENK